LDISCPPQAACCILSLGLGPLLSLGPSLFLVLVPLDKKGHLPLFGGFLVRGASLFRGLFFFFLAPIFWFLSVRAAPPTPLTEALLRSNLAPSGAPLETILRVFFFFWAKSFLDGFAPFPFHHRVVPKLTELPFSSKLLFLPMAVFPSKRLPNLW